VLVGFEKQFCSSGAIKFDTQEDNRVPKEGTVCRVSPEAAASIPVKDSVNMQAALQRFRAFKVDIIMYFEIVKNKAFFLFRSAITFRQLELVSSKVSAFFRDGRFINLLAVL
jgi:hypothetical protein